MSYASLEAQKGTNDLALQREKNLGALELANTNVPGVGWGAQHILSAPEASLRGADIKANADMYGAGAQADAYRYMADMRLREAAVPRTSTSFSSTIEPVPSWNQPEERAKGGHTQARRPYLVGEKGPELMVPDQSGTIIPNHKLPMALRQAVPRRDGGPVKAHGAPPAGYRIASGYNAREAAADASKAAWEKQWADFAKDYHSVEKVGLRAAQERMAQDANEKKFRAYVNSRPEWKVGGKLIPAIADAIDELAGADVHRTDLGAAVKKLGAVYDNHIGQTTAPTKAPAKAAVGNAPEAGGLGQDPAVQNLRTIGRVLRAPTDMLGQGIENVVRGAGSQAAQALYNFVPGASRAINQPTRQDPMGLNYVDDAIAKRINAVLPVRDQGGQPAPSQSTVSIREAAPTRDRGYAASLNDDEQEPPIYAGF